MINLLNKHKYIFFQQINIFEKKKKKTIPINLAISKTSSDDY